MMRLQRTRSRFRLRLGLYLAGSLLTIGSLLGRALTGPHGGEDLKAEQAATARIVGPVVLGTVDTESPLVPYGLPPVLQSGTIAEVHVKEGQQVAVDQPLYEFDASVQRCDLDRASVGVQKAENEVKKALEAEVQHNKQVALLSESVAIAASQKEFDEQKEAAVKNNKEEEYGIRGYPKAEWPARLARDPDLLKARADAIVSRSNWELKQKELDRLKTVNISLVKRDADIGVLQAKAEYAKAKNAVDLCVVRARSAGTIEQISINSGATLGIGTQKPALWLIPKGSRIVRAEIEAEFAHRISPKLVGKEVTIYDNIDTKLTYRGKVRWISDAFLRKRSASEGLLGSDTLVLEAVIDVTDAAPADRPPLRVGQRVRVDLGQ